MGERARRRRAAREMARRMAELDRLDREYGLGAMPTSSSRPRRERKPHGPVLPGLLITALLLAGIVAWSPAENMESLRRLVGIGDERLGVLPETEFGQGSFSFLQLQRGGDEPVGYDPCRVIEVVVNPAGAPDDYDELVDTGLARTGAATGLVFERVGLTDDRDVLVGPFARRRPVLIAWALPDEVPELAGDVAGIGGSVATGAPGRLRYVTGRVVLDQELFAGFGPRETPFAQAIVDHELAHVVGLGHVDDPGELMYDDNLGRTTYGPGDREGLARLGAISC
ncbi:hypothetical protein NOMA109596_18385 [Nocardioides marinus]|uniref:Matrixin n=1 Tax=Nocardioides marinus TaxID=374514 RepID=A0A7Y9YCU6_9ACTN|nr:hypothetical protein [Nocardioides marinus]NYI09808.1 hypothetical protein [Nocardioides marinus]